MFIFLSKFLPLFVYPIGLTSLILLINLLFWRRKKLSKILVILAFFVLFIGGNRFLANTLAKSLEWRYPTFESGQPVDLIVVLGGSTEPKIDPRPMTEIGGAADRILYAAKLLQDYPDAKVLLSGGDITFLDQGTSTPAQDMADILKLMGVDESSMLLQDRSQNTYEDALYSCEMIRASGYQHVVLVTSAMHMPRSVKLFEKQGCEITAAPTDFAITVESWHRTWHPTFEEFLINFVPSYSNVSLVTKAMKEYIGLWMYGLKGWL